MKPHSQLPTQYRSLSPRLTGLLLARPLLRSRAH